MTGSNCGRNFWVIKHVFTWYNVQKWYIHKSNHAPTTLQAEPFCLHLIICGGKQESVQYIHTGNEGRNAQLKCTHIFLEPASWSPWVHWHRFAYPRRKNKLCTIRHLGFALFFTKMLNTFTCPSPTLFQKALVQYSHYHQSAGRWPWSVCLAHFPLVFVLWAERERMRDRDRGNGDEVNRLVWSIHFWYWNHGIFFLWHWNYSLIVCYGNVHYPFTAALL